MATVHALVLALALVALVFLPCAVALVICADGLSGRVRGRLRRRRERRLSVRVRGRLRRRRERRTLQRLDRMLGGPQKIPIDALDQRRQPSIEQLAADLRRLDRQRLGVATQSQVWHAAVRLAYDDRLRLASRCLGVAEHLDQLDGVDLEIERLRVEGELQAAGLALRSRISRRQDH